MQGRGDGGRQLGEQVTTDILLRGVEPSQNLIHDMGVRNVTFHYFYNLDKSQSPESGHNLKFGHLSLCCSPSLGPAHHPWGPLCLCLGGPGKNGGHSLSFQALPKFPLTTVSGVTWLSLPPWASGSCSFHPPDMLELPKGL